MDFDAPRIESNAFSDTGETSLGREIVGPVEAHSGKAGFYLLPNGIDALAHRILLAERAERSIDLQYYLIKNDVSGKALLRSLLRAADRGVRVRFLLDDVFTGGYDAALAALDAHPNFEIRIFNPFANRNARFIDGLTGFARVNRRMHNKSFTVDNQISIIGGRNLADEYFAAREDVNFGDLDVTVIGPIVTDISAMFDSYWSHRFATPMSILGRRPDDPAAGLERVREAFEQAHAEIINTPYADAVRTTALDHLQIDAIKFAWAPYVLAVDSPDKAIRSEARDADQITTPLFEAIMSAKREVVILSPYFVPRKRGVEALAQLRERGVDVTIVTNSLAANNHTVVHGGYAPSRKPLLQAGARIFEVRPDITVLGTEVAAAEDSLSTLHTKAFVVDRQHIFIGSFNFDPRSANLNTELGVIIHSPEIASEATDDIESALRDNTYEVFLNDRGNLRWRSVDGGAETVYTTEPETSWTKRFSAGFFRLLPIRGQL